MKVVFVDCKPVVRYEEIDLVRTSIKTRPLKCISKTATRRYYISIEEDCKIKLVHAIRGLLAERDFDKASKIMYEMCKIHRKYVLQDNLGLFNSYGNSSYEFCFLADFLTKLNLRSGSITLNKQHFVTYCSILSQLLNSNDVFAFTLVNNFSFLLDILILGIRCNRGNTVKELCTEWLRSKTPSNRGHDDVVSQYNNLRVNLSKFCSDL